jgi:O-antigen/teichoic acid export membrane protein
MQAPMSLIGLAIGQVFLSRAPDEHRAGRLPSLTTDTLSHLLKTGIGPLIAAGIVSPFVFSFIFGPEWQRAGQLVSWMTPWFVLQFLVVPIAMAMHVTGHQKHALFLQLFGLALRVFAVIAAATWAKDRVGEAYAISGMIFYFAYMLLVLSVTKVPAAQFFRSVAASIRYVFGWTALGVAAAFAFDFAVVGT